MRNEYPMRMKVILIKDVGGVGQRGVVKEVADGYAINSLIPRGLAVQATPAKIAEHEKQRKQEEARATLRDEEWTRLIKTLSGAKITIMARANEKGHLYQSLSSEMIAEEIDKTYNVVLPKEAVSLEQPIKTVGITQVEIQLGTKKALITVELKTS